jgi:hypothetical protein
MIRTLCGLAWALSVEVACAQQAGAELNDTVASYSINPAESADGDL